jgi:5-methylcytosine-specific restriction enzyme B
VTTTSDLIAQMLFTGANVLGEHPDGLRPRELWPLIAERLPGIEEQWWTVTNGKSSARQTFDMYTIHWPKVGWVHKSGRWHLTGFGREALARWPEPTVFFRAQRSGYAYWERHRDGFERVKQLAAAIPEGSWVSLDDLVQETGLGLQQLASWLQSERPENWHRVLNAGRLALSPEAIDWERQSWTALLDEDGLDAEGGRADPSRRIPVADLTQLAGMLTATDEDAPRRAWLVRGSNVEGENLIRTLWLPQGVCSLPATRLRELPPAAPVELVRHAVNADYGHKNVQDRARLTAEYHAFVTSMRENDVVVTNDGTSVYLGVVGGAAMFVSGTSGRANLQRPVRWRNADDPLDYGALPDEFAARVANPDAQLIELTDFTGELGRLLGEGEEEQPPAPREARLPDATEKLAEDLLIDRDTLQEWIELLRGRPQLVFYGPPGTGKTYVALHLAEHLAGGKPENVQLVQFHPAYSYEDFFEGYRPRTTEQGTIAFELVRGPFRRLAAAASDHPGEPYVLIIDEINRGNLAKVFGELYFLLEYRKRSVNLLYGSDEGQGFSLPANLFVIGTMNTADRSIALMDTAMRRRFSFVELHPSEPPVDGLLESWLKREGYDDRPARLLAALNDRIADRDFRIGPSYLMQPAAATEEGLRRIWRTQILPLLEEHHYGDGTDVRARYGLDAL